MNDIDELHSLVRDLKLYITQEYPHLQHAEKPDVTRPSIPAVHVQPVIKQPVKLEPLTVTAKPAAIPKAKEPELPKTPLEPIMQALCRPFVKPAMVSLLDCVDKLKKLGVHTIDAPEKSLEPIQTELVVVSFFAPGSQEEQFIQKVASSVQARLCLCSIYLQPGLNAAAECFTLAASGAAKAIVLAYQQNDAQKLAQWLAYFGDDVKVAEIQKSEIAAKRILFSSPVYELVLTLAMMNDPIYKRSLWNDIQAIVCQ
jgi:hypothetical protein